jgi:hypothetical protein
VDFVTVGFRGVDVDTGSDTATDIGTIAGVARAFISFSIIWTAFLISISEKISVSSFTASTAVYFVYS